MSIRSSIEQKLQRRFAPVAHLDLENESHQHASGPEAETHFRLVLVSDRFDGVGRLDRQRQVMDCLAEERARGLHALTLRTYTPTEWDQVKDSLDMVSPPCYGGSRRK